MINKSEGLKVEIGPHWTISSIRGGGVPSKGTEWPREHSAWHGPSLERFRDGSLLVKVAVTPDYYVGPDHLSGRLPLGKAMMLYSVDNGNTWWFDSLYSQHGGTHFEAKDGMRYLFGGTLSRDYHYPIRQRDSLVVPRYLSYDGGKSWEGPETVYLHIPQAKGTVFNGRSFLELPDGKLINATHLCFKDEEKIRVIIVISEDKGRHWEYLSTVAYDPDINTEGFTEPALLQLPLGELLCVMRTEGFHPMMQSFSSDLGKSWSPPVKTGVDGVCPDLCLMQSGIVACAYGRPGCNIMFSLDGTGREWSHHTVIIPPFEPKKGGTWSHCYNAVREIRPGELLYVYNIAGHPEGWHGGALPTREELLESGLPTLNSIKATIIKVRRKTGK